MRRLVAALAFVAVLAAWGGVAFAAGVATYNGSTSQDHAFTLTVASDGVKFRIDWSAGCGDGAPDFKATTSSQRGLPSKAGSFSSHETYDAKASDGATVHYSIAIAGTIHRRVAAGSWRAVATGPYKDGGTYKCETGKVTWKARRAG
jgi:hypothetical protein